MNDKDPSSKEAAHAHTSAPQPDGAQPEDASITEQPATQRLEADEREMSGFEKSTLRWARTAVILSGIAAIFVCAQWWEMRKGGNDTHSLAVAAGNQALWAQRLAISAGTESGDMNDLAAHMKDQADRTKDLADQAKSQAVSAKISADAARSAAETAKDSLIQVQRAVMTVSNIDVSREAGKSGQVADLLMFVHWKNVGGTPTKNLTIRTNYLATPRRLPNDYPFTDIPDPPSTSTDTPSFAAPQGVVTAAPVSIPVEEVGQIVDGRKVIYVWGHADYRDVFSGTPLHTSQYCFVVTGFYGDIYSTSPNETTVANTENCPTHNCLDDECKAN